MNMMDDEKKEIIFRLCANEKVKINERCIHLFQFGYVYIYNNNLIIPNDLAWFIEDLFM